MADISLPLSIEQLHVASLLPYARNARIHDKGNVRKLVQSIREFGWTQPILITDGGEIIAGHGRVLAAMDIGLESVPCIRLSNLTDEQIRAYRIADNQLALDSEWDEELLARELGDLSGIGFHMPTIGFDAGDLRKYLAADERSRGETGADEDAIVPESAAAVSKPGQIWELDRHRLACGDCTDPMNVNPLLAGVSLALMVTDPPYGVNYQPSWRRDAGLNNSERMDDIVADHRADWRGAWAYFNGPVAYVWHSGTQSGIFMDSLIASGFEIRSQIVWVKPNIVIGRSHYHWKHEPCWYTVRRGQDANWAGDRKQSTVWEIASVQDDPDQTTHGAQKPVECMRRPILNHTREGDAVYDPFLGSGSTLIAAEATGRVCYGVEIMPKYVDMAIRRWEGFTGKDAVCEGRTFKDWESDLNRQAV
jgi:DNA modification methylase